MIPNPEPEKEQMIYMGFTKHDSNIPSTSEIPNENFPLESKDSIIINENLLQIIKQDEKSKDVYTEFSHQQLNKSVFEINKEKTPQKYSAEKIFIPADPMERDYDINPENLINFDNFSKYLNEQRPEDEEANRQAIWGSFDLRISEKNSYGEDNSKIEEEVKKEDREHPKLEHSFTQNLMNNLELSKIEKQSYFLASH